MGGIDRRRANGKPRASAESCRTCVLRDEKQYQSLVRLAALLTGDASLAETVAADAIIALPCSTPPHHSDEHCIAYLQRQVVARSRRRRYRPASERQRPADQPGSDAAAGCDAPAGRAAPTEFARLPVVAALRRLSPPVREAVVLTYYLDLPTARAASVAGVSEAALRANLVIAMRALDDDQLAEP
jgi:DNA-directed RNA polymerase specialized sigma24 family protein